MQRRSLARLVPTSMLALFVTTLVATAAAGAAHAAYADKPIHSIVPHTPGGFEDGVWYGLAVPGGTPKDIVDRLDAEFDRAPKFDEVRTVFAQQGVETLGGSTGDFDRYFREQDAKWAAVVRKADIKLD